MGTVLPKVQSGEVVKVELHRRFTMLPEKEYGNVKLPAAHYTPDFVLTYADGTVEVVEVKSKFTRRQQRAVNIQKNQLTTHTFILYHQREPRSTI